MLQLMGPTKALIFIDVTSVLVVFVPVVAVEVVVDVVCWVKWQGGEMRPLKENLI